MPKKPKLPTRRTAIQFGKYLIGGSTWFISAYIVFFICFTLLGWWWLWAKLLADGIGFSLNYLVQRYWAFAGDRVDLREMEHVGRYITIETVGFVLDYLIIGGLYYIGVTPYIGFFISAAFFTVWSYLWYRYWVFPQQHHNLQARQ